MTGSSRKTQVIEVTREEIDRILERARAAVDDQDYEKLKGIVDTLEFLSQKIASKNASLGRLRRLLFGRSTEKTSELLPEKTEQTVAGDAAAGAGATTEGEPARAKRKGHGRNGAAAFKGAKRVEVTHDGLSPGDPCPEDGCEGKLYHQQRPRVIVRFASTTPIQATVYAMERLRCSLCGRVFTAPAPPGVGEKKYDETVSSMIACLRYGAGFPFHRLAKLQRQLGVPLPEGTQWELIKEAAGAVAPVHEELIRQAAQGEVLHNDDTPMKILEVIKDRRSRDGPPADEPDRKAVSTTGIIALQGEQRIALFFTGTRNAGENLEAVLQHRAAELQPPIQMCDALASNRPGDFEVLLANCTSHSRRRYVDAVASFPEECRYVLESIAEVYKVDAVARERSMSPEERLRLHQAESGPIMEKLHEWLEAQFAERTVEPNSSIGQAINYMLNHWEPLTLFLRQPGAPLDNNIAERSLKMAILHRKNSMFYRTRNGARAGDIFMTLIHTADLCGADPFHYLTELLRHAEAVSQSPGAWLPWNYKDSLAAAKGNQEA